MTLEIEYSPEAEEVRITLDSAITMTAYRQSETTAKFVGFNRIDDSATEEALKHIASILLNLTMG